MDLDKPSKITISAEEKADTANINIIVAEAGPIGGPKQTFTFATTTSSGDIVTTVTKPYEALLEPETKEFMIETVERSKKHFVEGLRFSFSPKDWSISFELRREPEKVTTTKLTGKKEKKG